MKQIQFFSKKKKNLICSIIQCVTIIQENLLILINKFVSYKLRILTDNIYLTI